MPVPVSSQIGNLRVGHSRVTAERGKGLLGLVLSGSRPSCLSQDCGGALKNLHREMSALRGIPEAKEGNRGAVTGSLAHTCKQVLSQEQWMLLSDWAEGFCPLSFFIKKCFFKLLLQPVSGR